MEAVVSVEHLSKRYGETVAVADVSFEVAEREIFGLIGPNRRALYVLTAPRVRRRRTGILEPDGSTCAVRLFRWE